MDGCLSENVVVALVAGSLPPADLARAESHLDGCASCREVLAHVLHDDPPKAKQIGRYRVLRRVGSGSMGTVYAAEDPDLEREVAIKVLRSSAAGDGEAGRARFLREARAMARLAHPNVITVYEFGLADDQIFIAMELVKGWTLEAWLHDAPRGWREIADMMCAAGRGLEAAHAAGVVHRDFKPDNVLIGSDGRARVTDFGLAHLAAGEAPSLAESPVPAPLRKQPIALTGGGALIGTPAYMAPEQLRGEVADERSDLFSFCITFWEALYGERPFAGRALDELVEAVALGRLRSRPPGCAVPDALHEAIRRGLELAPSDRWSSMTALLGAVEAALAKRGAAHGTEVFVGRERELGTLEALLAEAQGGRGRLALITGEPGIGKSRLAEELTSLAAKRGWRAAWGRAWEGGGTPAYWPWTQALRRLNTLPDFAPAFAGVDLGCVIDPERPMPEAPDAEAARFQLFDRVARSLFAAAEVRPIVLVLDDLHAADAATLALLHFVARGLHGARVLVVATTRDAAFAAGPHTSDLLARIARDAQQIPLERLGRDELHAWVAQVAPRLSVERLWALSEGNPLFVSELLAAARSRPDAAWTTSQLPMGIRGAVRMHLALLEGRALGLLETASVLGREHPRMLLQAVAPAQQMAALDEALATGILLEAGDGRLRFSHVLLRDELYARLSDQHRRALHRDAAQASRDRTAAAHHALLGMRPEDAPETLLRVHAAMSQAASRLAHEDAARLGQAARAALEPHIAPADLCGLKVAIAEALVRAGDVPGGQALAEEAARSAEELGLDALLVRAALVRAADLGFGIDGGSVRWLRRALDVVPDARLRMMGMGRVSVAPQNDDPQRRQQLQQAAVALARRLGDEQALFTALHSATGAYPEHLEPRERFALYAETIELAERLGTVGQIAPVLIWHVVSWLEIGSLGGAEAAATRVERLLAPYTRPQYRWRLPLVRAMLASIAGRFADADRMARESLAISREHALHEGLIMYVAYRVGATYVRGDDDGIAEELPLFEEALSPLLIAVVLRAMWEAPLGRADRVREAFRQLRALGPENVSGAAQLGWACERGGITEDAELFYQLAAGLPRTMPLGFGPSGFACMGPISLLRARLAAMTGRRDEAMERFAEAAVVARGLTSPPFVAQAELGWAELLAVEQPASAVEHARIAFAEAHAVGMDTIAARAERLMAPT